MQTGIYKCEQTCKTAAFCRLTATGHTTWSWAVTTHWSEQRDRNKTCQTSLRQLPGFLILFSHVNPKKSPARLELVSETWNCFSGVHWIGLLFSAWWNWERKPRWMMIHSLITGNGGHYIHRQAKTLKQRKRCTFFSLHMIVPWHISWDTVEAKNKCWCKKILDKLMAKIGP